MQQLVPHDQASTSSRRSLVLALLFLACDSTDDASATESESESGGDCVVEPGQVVDVACHDCTVHGQGNMRLDIYGEDYIENGIPASDMDDGWAVKFDKFLVHVNRLSAKRYFCTNDWLEDPTGYITNVATPTGGFGQNITSETVAIGPYNNVGFTIGPSSVNARSAGATPEEMAIMTNEGFSIYMSGFAQNGVETKTFHWGFRTDQPYQACHGQSTVTETQGGRSVISIHGDHMFFNSYSAKEALMLFGGYALADKDGDGEITEDELRVMPVAEAGINVGRKPITNVWQWLEGLSQEVGHIDGDQHCHSTEEHTHIP